MFESLFNKSEKISEPEEQEAPEVEVKRTLGIDPGTGIVMSEDEVKQERKENLEDPTRRYDLK